MEATRFMPGNFKTLTEKRKTEEILLAATCPDHWLR